MELLVIRSAKTDSRHVPEIIQASIFHFQFHFHVSNRYFHVSQRNNLAIVLLASRDPTNRHETKEYKTTTKMLLIISYINLQSKYHAY